MFLVEIKVWVFTIWGEAVVRNEYPDDPFEARLTVRAQSTLAAAVSL